ncbi:hypothetical protein [Miltoncostaea marina]|uniref:hypothetical protein n=1 Tax=Miltoncostaea marina TaxID=2843215 RepID=UPI001C3D57DA|nr:hypothetical protein [Miltoncostaea marina]
MAATDDPGGSALGSGVGAAIAVLAAGLALVFGASRADAPHRIVQEVAALHDGAVEAGTPPLGDRPSGFARWALRAGWVPIGARSDVLEGRRVETVVWQRSGRRIGHSRIAGAPVRVPDDARRSGRNGLLLRSLDVRGRVVVAWTEGGSTTVISAVGISRASLYDLAAGPAPR